MNRSSPNCSATTAETAGSRSCGRGHGQRRRRQNLEKEDWRASFEAPPQPCHVQRQTRVHGWSLSSLIPPRRDGPTGPLIRLGWRAILRRMARSTSDSKKAAKRGARTGGTASAGGRARSGDASSETSARGAGTKPSKKAAEKSGTKPKAKAKARARKQVKAGRPEGPPPETEAGTPGVKPSKRGAGLADVAQAPFDDGSRSPKLVRGKAVDA